MQRVSPAAGMLLAFLAAGVSTAHGQRLPPSFPPTPPVQLFTHDEPLGRTPAFMPAPGACRISPVLVVALEVVGGAVAGLIAYELTVGILIAGEGANSQPFARDIRYSLMAAGAIFGAVRGIQRCHAASAGG